MTATQIRVRLSPRASSDELRGIEHGVLQARVAAAPVDGRANQALCKLIAKRLEVAPSRVEVVRGEKSRMKLVRVQGIDEAVLRAGLSE